MTKGVKEIALMIWTNILSILTILFGPAMQPRKFVETGADPKKDEIPYDENKMVIDAWVDALMHWGVRVTSPVVALWVAMGVYFAPRAGIIAQGVRRWFSRKKAAPGGPVPFAAPPRSTPTETTGGPAPAARAPAAEAPAPAAGTETPAPPMASGDVLESQRQGEQDAQ